jgi:hypothetical protein
MQVHQFDTGTSTRSTREPQKVVTLPINRAVFDSIHKGRTLHAAPKNYASCRPGFEYYQTADGQIMGIRNA